MKQNARGGGSAGAWGGLAMGLALVCGSALAQPYHAGDIVLSMSPAGDRLMTARADAVTGELDFTIRTYAATLGEAPNFTNDPGFDSGPGALPAGSEVGFTLRRALRVWQGGTFDTIPEERVQVRFGPLGPVLSPLTDEPVPGFSLAVSADGQFHHHLGYTLLEPAAPGIYLLELELWSTVPGVGPSRPLWLVINQETDEAIASEAIAWALANVQGCPSDLNQDYFVDAIDYDLFIGAFVSADPLADFNLDGFVDAIDYDRFIARWLAGC